ncbi:hypothetical protein ACFW5D_06970 [Streptomyces sp. NPDC058770]|uniref:hypothetical protein n=1 Tax=unclassified Streptomyces TaxID=2593676 RepID=UPI0036AB5759
MRPERQDGTSDGTGDGTGGGGLPVPMAWMCAEYVADELLRAGDLMEPGTLEYRAGHDALALTVFLSGISGPGHGHGLRPPDDGTAGVLPTARMDELRLLTAYGTAWRDWVRERLDAREAAPGPVGGTAPDVALARAAWRWLEETELLAADLDAIGPPLPDPADGAEETEERARMWIPAWQLGLPLGHLAIHLH